MDIEKSDKAPKSQMTDIFKPRDQWVKQADTKTCHGCSESFSFFFANKQNCRMCGNVFHNKCANLFLKPPMFVFENEKEIRLCKSCYQDSQVYIARGSTRGLSLTNFLSQACILQIDKALNEMLKRHWSKLAAKMERYILENSNISQEWIENLMPIIKESIEFAQPKVGHPDAVDINNFIKVKKIMWADSSYTRIIKGLIIRRNITHKRMRSLIEKPNILLINGGIDLKLNEITNLDAGAVNKERETLENIAKAILKLQPNLVITNGAINSIVHDILLDAKVTLVKKMRMSQFQKVARYTNSKVITIEDLGNCDSSVCGNCERFEVMNLENMQYLEDAKKYKPDENWANYDTSFMVFDGCNTEFGVSITLSGQDFQDLMRVKKSLKEIFKIMRYLELERTVIFQEILLNNKREKLWKILTNGKDKIELVDFDEFRKNISIKAFYEEILKDHEVTQSYCLLNESTFGSTGYFDRFVVERYGINRVITRNGVSFAMYTVIPIDFSSIPDLASNINVVLKSKLDNKLQNSNRMNRQEICQLETPPETTKLYFHDKSDLSIGTFLAKAYGNMTERCEKCDRFYYYHTDFYLIGDLYIKVTYDLKEGPRLEYVKRESKTLNSKLKKFEPLMSEKEGFFEFLASFTPMKKDEGNQYRDVMMYIECVTCKNKICEPVKLRHAFLDYPLSRYLENMAMVGDEYKSVLKDLELSDVHAQAWEGKQKISLIPIRANTNYCCAFGAKNRVFMVEDGVIKFRMGYSHPYSITFLSISDDYAKRFRGEAHKELIDKKKVKAIELEKSYIYLLTNNLKAIIEVLIDRSNLEINVDNCELILEVLNDKNPLSKEPSNILLINLVHLYQGIIALNNSINTSVYTTYNNHIEVDLARRYFYEQICEFADLLEKKKNEYLQALGPILKKNVPIALEDILDNGVELSDVPHKQATKSEASTKPETSVKSDSFKSESILKSEKSDSHSDLGDADTSRSSIEPSRKRSLNQSESSKANVIRAQSTVQDKNEIDNQFDLEVSYSKELIAGKSDYYDEQKEEDCRCFRSMPIFEEKPLSAIAYCLNSPFYYLRIYGSEGRIVKYNQIQGFSQIDNLMQSGNKQEFENWIKEKFLNLNIRYTKAVAIAIPSFEINLRFFNQILLNIPNKNGDPWISLKKQQTEKLDDPTGFDFIDNMKPTRNQVFSQKYFTTKGQLIVHCPTQFEALRAKNEIYLKDFVESISCSSSWEDNTGGKTGASFIKTFDQRFVFKQIERKEFNMLVGFLQEYLQYLWEVMNSKKPSLLAKIYGVFELQYDKKGSSYFIAMENLFFGMSSDVVVYDLKGSELNRFVKDVEGKRTFLDTNYKVDRNGEPLFIRPEYYDFFDKAIRDDSNFLANLRVIDYSLLVVMDENRKNLRMGIIDYLRIYDFEKQIESVGKKIIKGMAPTIVSPEEYRDRFQKYMKRYFMTSPLPEF